MIMAYFWTLKLVLKETSPNHQWPIDQQYFWGNNSLKIKSYRIYNKIIEWYMVIDGIKLTKISPNQIG